MIFLLIFGLYVFPLEARFFNAFNVHFSDALRLKCDALPYRTAYIGTQCYFAVTNEVKLDNATAQCSSIVHGSTVVADVPAAIFKAMMLDKSRYHGSRDSSGKVFKSSGAKQSICLFDSGYTCDAGQQSNIIPGKCFANSDVKRTYENAEIFCSRLGMEIPSIENELDNRMVRGAIANEYAWIRYLYQGATSKKWTRDKYFSKHSTCHMHNILCSGEEMMLACGGNQYLTSAVMIKTGLWGYRPTFVHWIYGTVCVKNAENDFTTGRKRCPVPHHEWDEETGQCEWTGPKDSCLQVTDVSNRSFFMLMPNFPKQTFKEIDTGNELPWNDVTTKVVVRRGCMFTAYRAVIIVADEEKMAGCVNRPYGEYPVPCYYTGDFGDPWDGMSRIACFCDPTEATLNGHEPAPPPKKKCIEHHVFNETTQQCEWKHDNKFCGELITHDGRKQMIEIPNWPTNKRYDVHHWNQKRAENFHLGVTEIIVRQHCWATLMRGNYDHERKTLETSGYGKYQVMSYYNGLTSSQYDGTLRVVCECIR